MKQVYCGLRVYFAGRLPQRVNQNTAAQRFPFIGKQGSQLLITIRAGYNPPAHKSAFLSFTHHGEPRGVDGFHLFLPVTRLRGNNVH